MRLVLAAIIEPVQKQPCDTVNRLTALINDVLDINRIETGRMTLEKSPVQMESVVKNIIQENKPFADAKKIKINAAGLDQSCPLEVDGGKIERVVNELVNNAIKYTSNDGQVEITLNKAPHKNLCTSFGSGRFPRP